MFDYIGVIWNTFWHQLLNVLIAVNSVVGSAGLSIIIFTILMRMLTVPFTLKALRSSRNMQAVQPLIKEIQKKHGKDRQRLTQETMALYQQHRVNPMAGCLPMLLQIPVFLGLYNAILYLSREGAGVWDQSFLWIPDLSQPDALRILPIMAAVFQFVQTKMMRPSGMGKIDDPQQAMMNTMMNFMPLTVIFFGWSFASGPVLYWAAQSVYSVIQQWFITGWGRMIEWMPFLPELPEHRRLGYRPPRDLDEVVVVSGGEPVYGPGPMGWMQRKMNEAQKQAMERSGAQAATGAATTNNAVEAEVVSASSPGKNGAARPRSKNARTKGKKGSAKPAASVGAADGPNGGPPSIPSGAVIVPRKAKPAPEGTRSEVV